MKHSEGSRKFREYHEKLEDLQEELRSKTWVDSLHVPLDALNGCVSNECVVYVDKRFLSDIRAKQKCPCLSFLVEWMKEYAAEYLKAKRELS